MSDATIANLIGGSVGIILGILMITQERVATWSFKSRSGQMWVKILGQERAMKAIRFVFGPLVFLFGTVMAIGVV